MENLIQQWLQLDDENQLRYAHSVALDLISRDARNDDQFINTDFSKWAYFKQKYQIRGVESQALYIFRKQVKKHQKNPDHYPLKNELLHLAKELIPAIGGTISDHTHWKVSKNVIKPFLQEKEESEKPTREMRFLITGREDKDVFLAEKNNYSENLRISFSPDSTFLDRRITEYFGTLIPFPFYVQAFDIDWIDEIAHPEYFVLVPDYLIDVTAIASGFANKNFTPWIYFHHKLLPRTTTYYMMLGNIVNMMLDQIIGDHSISLEKIFPMIFRKNIVEVNKMNDEEVRKLLSDVQMHFRHLKNTVEVGFPKLGIEADQCALEPSFLSNKYGIQGRLDVLFQGKQVSIIELKSGKPFRPNAYGIKADHYVQTLLYDLLLKSAGVSYNSRNFILYSSQAEKSLRYAPPLKALQIEALRARNEIFILDSIFASRDKDQLIQLMRQYLTIDLYSISPFVKRDGDILRKTIQSSAKIHWSYYQEYLSFVQREMMVSKLGQVGLHEKSGHAGLWLKEKKEKEEEFSILFQLRFEKLEKGDEEILIHFSFTDQTNPLANFRVGDVVVIYPELENEQNILRHQVIKASLVHMSNEQITFRSRSNQLEEKLFDRLPFWSVERDVLDSSFKSMFDSLFLFLHYPTEWKNMWLGIRPPSTETEEFPMEYQFAEGVLPSQVDMVKRAYSSKDYFLIWGPPGTGKTSIVLRELVRTYIETGNEDLFLLSYTNRAVDEICQMVVELGQPYDQLCSRLGSRYSVGEDFADQLFGHQTREIGNREEMNDFLESKRIYMSTLSSFWGQRSLVREKSNSILIVDEASQILEPSIVGLLGMFKKVILIGDHLQLPAVSLQNDGAAEIQEESLREIGIVNAKMSLFHRLYRRCQYKNWEHALGLLYHQGRMHKDIMRFANEQFYGDQLKIIPDLDRLSADLSEDRLIYVASEAYPFQSMLKNNLDEAEKVVEIIQFYLKWKEKKIYDLEAFEVGVITPFRAQIALIRNLLESVFDRYASLISVDTVERYQGSARDVIIISACLNRRSQLESISSIGEEGVDRKFNVALTRAREQVILIGNADILSLSESYRCFIHEAKTLSLSGE